VRAIGYVLACVCLTALSTVAMAQGSNPAATPSRHRADLYAKNSLSISITFPTASAVIDYGTTPVVPINASITSGSPLEQVIATVCQSADGVRCVQVNPHLATIPIPAAGPYQALWTPPSLGGDTTTAVNFVAWVSASNAAGETATSSPTSFTYLFPPPRAAVLVVPGPDTGYYAPASPVLWATFTSQLLDPATVDHVDFLDGATVIASLRTPNSVPAGYAFLWNNAPIGEHAVSVRGVDTTGRITATPPVAMYVVPPQDPVSVSLSAPVTGQTYGVDASIPLRASATVVSGKIERVEFTDGASVIATVYAPPFETTWVTPTIGHHAIAARAFDDLGNGSASAAAYVETLAWPRKPTILMLMPLQGASFTSTTPVQLASAVEAGDAPITHVDYWLDGAIVASAASQPYTSAWSAVTQGDHVVDAAAYDSSGRATVSDTIAFKVAPDRTTAPVLPTVALTSPANNSSFVKGDSVHLTASAAQAGGSITRVDFKINGNLLASVTSPPWTANWSGMSPDNYTLTAVATSNVFTTSTSPSIHVKIISPPTTITLAAPPAGTTYYPGDALFLLPATMQVSGTVTHVEYYVDGELVGSSTSPPYGYELDIEAPGTHSIVARVYDSAGTSAQSPPLSITSREIGVHITSPADGAIIAATTVAIEGTYDGPPNTGVAVNGVIAINDGKGRFFINELTLADPQTNVTVVATSMGGSRVSQTITVSTSASADPTATHIVASQDEAIDSMSTRIAASTSNIASWRVIDLIGGTASAGAPGSGDIAILDFPAPGLYTPTMEVTDGNGHVTQKRLVLLVSSSADVAHAQMSIVNQLFDALTKQNKTRALATMTSELAGQFSSVFDALKDHWPAIVGSLGPMGATMYGLDTFEAAVSRTRDGQKYLYLIEGMRDSDGVWRIDSL